MIPRTVIHLLSGGLDSVTLLYDLHEQGCKVHCVLFDYKQPHVQELLFAKAHCKRLDVLWTTIELEALGGLQEPDWIVPNRNCILLSHAVNLAVKANAESVTIGCNKDDEAAFPDCRMAFIQLFNTMLTTAEIHVEVCAPYIQKTKREIATIAKRLDVPLHDVWSCYKGGAKPCGKCPACLKLAEALR